MPSHRIAARPPRGRADDAGIRTDPAAVAGLLDDAARVPGGRAAGVACPATEADVAAILARTPRVLPIGAQSSLTGGATPRGDVVLDLRRLDRILSLDGDEATVQPGVPIRVLQAALARAGRYYPPAPTFDGACAGGVTATNAAGAATFKYGATRRWVRRLTVVLATGDVLDLTRGRTRAHPDGYFEVVTAGGRVRRVPVPAYRMPDVAKCAAGYFARPGMDLIDLFIGSEGTLGVVTEITFAVVAPAPRVAMVWAPLASEAAAVALAGALRDDAAEAQRHGPARGIDVAAIEHLDGRSLAIVRADGAARRHHVAAPDDAGAAVLIQVELPPGADAGPAAAYDEIARALASHPAAAARGDDPAVLRHRAADGPPAARPAARDAEPDAAPAAGATPLGRLARRLADAGALDQAEIALPGDRRRHAALLAVREAVPEGVNRRVGEAQRREGAPIEKTAADMIVPFARLDESLTRFRAAFGGRGLDYAIWGHLSDGNVHPNVIPRTMDDVARGREAILECGRAMIRLGGCPLAEHGVGRNRVKQALLRELYGAAGLDGMRAVKAALDPAGVLARDVIFPYAGP